MQKKSRKKMPLSGAVASGKLDTDAACHQNQNTTSSASTTV
jgi:hypothetical protein